MKTFTEQITPFLEHLANCQGCTGKRKVENCKYALECITAEILSRKGLVKYSEDLLPYCINNPGTGYFPKGCYSPHDDRRADFRDTTEQ